MPAKDNVAPIARLHTAIGGPAAGADRGGGILQLRSGVARAPPRPLNGITIRTWWEQ